MLHSWSGWISESRGKNSKTLCWNCHHLCHLVVWAPPGCTCLTADSLKPLFSQLFLHSVFGYRGVVLFPWQARLYDRDVASAAPEKAENPAGHGSKEVKGKTHTYYQVLIDARDCPHISQRSQTEAVTFLANHDDSRALYAIPGEL